jgi:hypothetical protein
VFALAASLVIAVGSIGWAEAATLRTRDWAAASQARLEYALASLRDTLAIMRSPDRVRHATISLDGGRGGLILFADDRSHRWSIVVYGLRPPRPGEVLQFWSLTEAGMVRGAQLAFPATGSSMLTMEMPAAAGAVMGAAVTLEREAPRGERPTGPELVHLVL